MKRREFIGHTASLGVLAAAAALPSTITCGVARLEGDVSALGLVNGDRLTPPGKGKIPVAFAISQGVTVIDFAGPWEVFQDVMVKERGKEMDEQMPFQLFTVSEKTEPLHGSGGLQLVPDYTFDNTPQPKVVVVPAQRGSEALHAWLRKVSETTDLTMSVCTGA